MARFKNHLLVVVGFAVAGMIGAAFGTGTAQAVVASLVEVVNPNTSPVPTNSVNVTDPGRIAYQSTVFNTGKCSSTECFFSFPTVPAGHRIVTQHISGGVDFTAPPTAVEVLIEGATATDLIAAFFAPISSLVVSLFDQSVLVYVDAGESITVELFVSGNSATFAAGAQFVTLTGYELDCTVATCAPIATQ